MRKMVGDIWRSDRIITKDRGESQALTNRGLSQQRKLVDVGKKLEKKGEIGQTKHRIDSSAGRGVCK